MVRKNTRKKRGGENQLMSDFRIKLDKVEEELKDLKNTLSTLENKSSSLEIVEEKNTNMEPIMETKSESIFENVNEPKVESPKTNILQENISLNGYNGLVSDIVSKIRNKITQLNKSTNKGKYDDKIKEYKSIISTIQNANTIDEVKSATQYKLVFKNNNLMGGKTRKNNKRNKNKSSKK